MLEAARREVLLPALDALVARLAALAKEHAAQPMLARTHGQTATPTTLGKEIGNVAVRLARARDGIAAVALRAKMNGAVGNYNAHVAAYPELRLAGVRAPRRRGAPRPRLQRRTRRRSSRTTRWPSCSTRSSAATRS